MHSKPFENLFYLNILLYNFNLLLKAFREEKIHHQENRCFVDHFEEFFK